jgi:alpha-amylase
VQRGHAGGDDVLTHQDWDVYALANIYMLAWPYGYPMVMSSYRIHDSDHGPPSARPIDQQNICNTDWVCEHRDPAIAAMVEFRRQTQSQPMTTWTQINPSAVAFGRGGKGFLAINAGTTAVSARVPVDLPPGRYGDILNGAPGTDNLRNELIVDEQQTVTISLPPMSAMATHVGALK